jgi:hypothetical protein
MKNSNIIKTLSFLSVSILLQIFTATVSQAASCDNYISEGAITNAGVTAKCTVTPDTVIFPVYKVGLCTEVPTYLNYQTACSIIFDKSSAVDITVNSTSKSTNMDLAGASGISLDNGTYKAAIVLLGNTISLKHTETFDSKRNGQKNSTLATASGTDDNGTVCVTRATAGSEDDFGTGGLESFLECYENVVDSNNPTAGLFVESGGAYLTEGVVCKIVSGDVVAPDVMTITDASGDLVKYCGMKDKDTLETYTSSKVTDATRQLVIQKFQTPVVTTSSTTAVNIGFKVTNMLAVEERTASSVQYTNYFIDGMSLNFTAN